jgi:hypothetical protein
MFARQGCDSSIHAAPMIPQIFSNQAVRRRCGLLLPPVAKLQ